MSLLDYPYVEPQIKGGRQRPSLIVLSSSFTTTDSGAAFGLTHSMHRGHIKESYHFVVDEAQTIRCVDVKMVAIYEEDTKHTVGVLLCDDPSGAESRWDDRQHVLLLQRGADLIARLCVDYKIRPQFLNQEELSAWQRWRIRRRGGIVTTGFMSQTYWPSDYFLTLVKANIEKHKLLKKK